MARLGEIASNILNVKRFPCIQLGFPSALVLFVTLVEGLPAHIAGVVRAIDAWGNAVIDDQPLK